MDDLQDDSEATPKQFSSQPGKYYGQPACRSRAADWHQYWSGKSSRHRTIQGSRSEMTTILIDHTRSADSATTSTHDGMGPIGYSKGFRSAQQSWLRPGRNPAVDSMHRRSPRRRLRQTGFPAMAEKRTRRLPEYRLQRILKIGGIWQSDRPPQLR